MGYIPSADTVYAVAYLTDIGRTYLFNKNNERFNANGDDLFEITKFTLSDDDTNYQTSLLLESGDVPDITGKNEGCLKTAGNYVQSNLIAYVFDGVPVSVEYSTDIPAVEGAIPVLNISEGALPISTETPPPLIINPNPNPGLGEFFTG
jgi:hypothetical protein